MKRYKSYDALAARVMHDLVQTFTMAESRLANRLHEQDMTLSGMNILTILRDHSAEGCPLNTLSQLLLVSRANITGLIDSLVRRGFVRRQDHATDRRIVLAKITKEGEKWMDSYVPTHCNEVKAMLSGLNQKEKLQLAELLTKLRHTSCHYSCARPRRGESKTHV